jgi:hypothetical protein
MPSHSTSEMRTPTLGPIDGRMKVINPLLSSGPSTAIQVLRSVESEIWIRAPRRVLIGATVHLRTAAGIFLGKVRHCEPTDTEHEIHVLIKERF